jgi:P27 family predicted phage terminase small subunit
MNKEAKKIYARLTAWLQDQNKYQAADVELIELAANVRAELDGLQAFIDKHGTTYEVVTRTGDVLHKHRPQHQQLVDGRTRYLTILRDLGLTPAARSKVGQIESEENVLDALLGSK